MAKKRDARKIVVNGIDLTTVFQHASVTVDKGLRAHFRDTRTALRDLNRIQREVDAAFKALEASDRMGNFEIQQLMSTFNQAETLASNVRKKMDDTMSCLIRKIG